MLRRYPTFDSHQSGSPASLRALLALAALALFVPAPTARGAYLTVYGGPTYDSSTGDGFPNGVQNAAPGQGVNDAGQAIGYALKSVAFSSKGSRAVRWDSLGNIEMGALGTNSSGVTVARAYAINASEDSVGYSAKYDSGNNYLGDRAVRWDSLGNITEMGALGTNSSGVTIARAYALNASGVSVGYSEKYDSGNNYQGLRAVRWDSLGNITEMGSLGTDSSGYASASAYALNASGVSVGHSEKYDSGNNYQGQRAVRWDSLGNITEMGSLGTDSSGLAGAQAFALNASGVSVGRSIKYDSGSVDKGLRAVRWDSLGNITEMGSLGTDSSGYASASAFALNASGVSVGHSEKYDSSNNLLGYRAVRWDSLGNATEFGALGTDSSGYTFAEAYAINASGIAVGLAREYDGLGNLLGYRAVYWGLDNLAVDLNTLVDPASGWVNLERALAISDAGWVSGYGEYDPDGPGGLDPYRRLFLLNINANDLDGEVPEPGTGLLTFALVATCLAARRRRGRAARSQSTPLVKAWFAKRSE